MVTREEILMASGAELDAVASRIDPNLYRSTSYATDFNGIGSCSYRIPKSDDKYREELLCVFDSMIDGGPAFGSLKMVGKCSIKTGGLTVRDYFAAKSMQGAMAEFSKMPIEQAEQTIDYLAAMSYAVADAMLRERAK